MYKRIRDLREKNNLTQETVAKVLNCSQPNYAKYESGFIDIPTQGLITLAKYYKTSTDYILGLTNNEMPYSAEK